MSMDMEVIYERCCGMDVHKANIVACLVTPGGKEIRTFGTMTDDLLMLADWLAASKCTHVAMESTGVYWKPVYNLLEASDMQVLVVNAKHIKQVPGRKTDMKDAEWIAKILRVGLLQGSYIPNREQRELRELVRYRRSLTQERAREVNRVQKVLEGANIKLASVASDIMGKSSRDMLEAMIKEETDPKALASMARGALKNKQQQLEKSLKGLMGQHQRIMLSAQLKHIDFLEAQVAELTKAIEAKMSPFNQAVELLDTIPGVGERLAQEILAETGLDMERFGSAERLASWAGMCPGNNESAGKKKSGKTTKGNSSLRTALVEAARAASKHPTNYLAAQYRNIRSRRGSNRAAVAVGHSILVIVYHILTTSKPYADLGFDHFEKKREDIIVRRAKKALEARGYQIVKESA